MPKYERIVVPGEILTDELRKLLNDHFSEKDFEKLSKFGGRIQISITAPFSDKQAQDKDLLIDDLFVDKLKSNPSGCETLLKNLTRNQLAIIAKSLHLTISKKTPQRELLNNILANINSETKWGNISGSTKS